MPDEVKLEVRRTLSSTQQLITVGSHTNNGRTNKGSAENIQTKKYRGVGYSYEITNKIIINLGNNGMTVLLRLINITWKTGELHAKRLEENWYREDD